MTTKSKRIISLICCFVLVYFSALPLSAYAASVGSIYTEPTVGADFAQNQTTQYAEQPISNTNFSTGVYLSIDNSDVVVSVPTEVILSGTPDTNGYYSGNYTVSAQGDFAGDEIIKIKPLENTFSLKQKGKSDKTALIEQDKTYFTYEDIINGDNTAQGTITATGLTAGSWNGQTVFEISMDKLAYAETFSTYFINEQADWIVGTASFKQNSVTEGEPFSAGSLANKMCVINTNLMYLPYGTAVVYDYPYDLPFSASKVYSYKADGTYIKEEVTLEQAIESGAQKIAQKRFVVSDEEGLYLRWCFLPKNGETGFTEDEKNELVSRLHFYDLKSINVPIFDYKSVTKAWDNTEAYEAWPTSQMFYNPNNNLYYAFYTSELYHTTTENSAGVWFRTSLDAETWSEPTLCYSAEDRGHPFWINGALQCANGDILVQLNDTYDGAVFGNRASFIRSSDNGETWTWQGFIVDGEDITGTGFLERFVALDNGQIYAHYSSNGKAQVNVSTIIFSNDNGLTWHKSDFQSKISTNEISEFGFALLNSGDVLCVERTGLGIASCLSKDNGLSFTDDKLINCVGSGHGGMEAKTCPELYYDKHTDSVQIYFIDRYYTGGLQCIYTTGNNITEWLLSTDTDLRLNGFETASCYLGAQGSVDQGYPEIIIAPDGSVKAYYYNRTLDEDGKQIENSASWYFVSSK